MHIEPIITVNFIEGELDVPTRSALPSLGCGGECLFVGRTRPQHRPEYGTLVELRYDCYQPMAKTQLDALTDEAVGKFHARAIVISHSIGSVSVGAASVVIAVGCDHRDDAFRACRFLIDALKLQVPIWKQEVWASRTTWSDGSLQPNIEIS